MGERLLFLDFDGVLHPNFCMQDQYFCRLPELVDVLGQASEPVKLVISSSWRFHHAFDEILHVFPNHLQSLIVGGTGEAIPGKHSRYNEIMAFLKSRRDWDDWRALDDSAFEFPDDCPQLIRCDGLRGIGNNEFEQLRSWLLS